MNRTYPSSPVASPVVQIRGLVTRFGDDVIHNGLDLDVFRGEILGVVGESGSGKSVLLKTIVGLQKPAAGHIELLGQSTTDLSLEEWQALQLRCGVLFQDGALFGSMTLGENVAVPLREHTQLPSDLRALTVQTKIAMVGLPLSAEDKHPAELSGGMRKRGGLARALALDPEILFLDEPTSGLDPINADAFDRLIQRLRQSLGLTVFMVTHDLDTLAAICDRIAVLVDKKVYVGTMEEMLAHPHPWIKSYFHGPRGRMGHLKVGS